MQGLGIESREVKEAVACEEAFAETNIPGLIRPVGHKGLQGGIVIDPPSRVL